MDTDRSETIKPLSSAKSGQALVEFCIGLVGMLAVIGGIFQLGRMGQARMDARVEATRSATARSMLSPDMTGLFLPRYIRAMDAGPSGFRHSVDDRVIGGNSAEAYDRLASRMRPERVRHFAPHSAIAQMEDPMEMMLAMGLVSGTGTEFNIPVMPIVRRLFFNRSRVDFQVQVWMTRTGDIY